MLIDRRKASKGDGLRNARLFAKAVAACCCLSAAATSARACGERLVIAPGDTIQSIAAAHYDSGLDRQLFISLNAHLLSQDALPAGDTIMVPCFTAPAGAGAGAEDADLPLVLIASDWPAFRNESRQPKGLFSSLLHASLAGITGAPEARLEANEDRAAHLSAVFEVQTADLSAPWIRPDCRAPGNDAERRLCAAALWSAPLFELESALYLDRRRAPARLTLAAIAENPICAAYTPTTRIAEVLRVAPTKLMEVRRANPIACLEMVARGQVLAAVAPVVSASAVLTRRPDLAALAQLEGIAIHQTVHAVADARRTDGPDLIAFVDASIAAARESGLWFDALRAHLGPGFLE